LPSLYLLEELIFHDRIFLHKTPVASLSCIDTLKVLENIFRPTGKDTPKITGSVSEGMCGGIHFEHGHDDYDFVLKARNIKLCTPRTNNVNNPPLLLLNDNGDYDASFSVEEEDNCPGYVKLLLAEMKTGFAVVRLCRRMNDDKRYFSSNSGWLLTLFVRGVHSLIFLAVNT
jgi:hypothetical protein